MRYSRVRVRLRFGSGSALGLDLRSWLLTHSWRSDAINFLLAYCQIAELTLSAFFIETQGLPKENSKTFKTRTERLHKFVPSHSRTCSIHPHPQPSHRGLSHLGLPGVWFWIGLSGFGATCPVKNFSSFYTDIEIYTYVYRSRPSISGSRTDLGNRSRVSGFRRVDLATLVPSHNIPTSTVPSPLVPTTEINGVEMCLWYRQNKR